MADADVIEIISSEEDPADYQGDSDEAASMSEGSEEYNYSSDDASDGLCDDPRPVSASEKKAPYRIIDGEALKQVQVCADSCVLASPGGPCLGVLPGSSTLPVQHAPQLISRHAGLAGVLLIAETWVRSCCPSG